MSEDYTSITAETRTEFGKGAARRIRRADKIPAVLYEHGNAPLHLTLPGHQTMMALKVHNALLTVTVDGKEHQALVKDVQRDAIKPVIDHVDLVRVRKGERFVIEVNVHVEGEAVPDTVVSLVAPAIEVEAEATNIPESFTVSVEGAEAGTQILAADISLPAGVTLVSDPEILVVNVTQAISQEALEAELAEAEAEAGIEQAEPESVEAEADEAAGGEEKPEGDES